MLLPLFTCNALRGALAPAGVSRHTTILGCWQTSSTDPSSSSAGASGILVTSYLASPTRRFASRNWCSCVSGQGHSWENCPLLLYSSCSEEGSLKCCSPTVNLQKCLNKANLPWDQMRHSNQEPEKTILLQVLILAIQEGLSLKRGILDSCGNLLWKQNQIGNETCQCKSSSRKAWRILW